MKIYKSFNHYLRNQPLTESCELSSALRPVIKLEKKQYFNDLPNFLIKIDEETYEVGFPLITLDDYDNHLELRTQVILELCKLSETFKVSLSVTEETFDATQISETTIQKRLYRELKHRYDHSTADLIGILLGVFYEMRFYKPLKTNFPLLRLPQCLQELSKDEARLPLVIALDRRYQLRHHLEIITPKLRSQLNRVAEMMPLGRIQEMDAYCLRDYVRRPGHDAAEKAGARQELMGVQRFQNYNTPENQFLKGFCELLHLECQEYIDHEQSKKLQSTIDYFLQEPTVQTIHKKSYLLGKPNYVLEQNAIYRSFYQAYLDYIHRRNDKEKLWGVRRKLAADIVAILILASLLRLEGSYTKSNSIVTILDTSNLGAFIEGKLPPIHCFLQAAAYRFHLIRQHSLEKGDWILNVQKQEINSPDIITHNIPIFVYWYAPDESTLHTLTKINHQTICFCFSNPIDDFKENEKKVENPQIEINSQVTCLYTIPNLIKNDWQKCTLFVAEKMIKCFGGL